MARGASWSDAICAVTPYLRGCGACRPAASSERVPEPVRETRLGSITRRGDAYLRTLLVQGARSALKCAQKCPPERASRLQQWIVQLHARVGYQKTLVAIANKNARVIWALLARNEDYNPEAWKAYAPAKG